MTVFPFTVKQSQFAVMQGQFMQYRGNYDPNKIYPDLSNTKIANYKKTTLRYFVIANDLKTAKELMNAFCQRSIEELNVSESDFSSEFDWEGKCYQPITVFGEISGWGIFLYDRYEE